MNAFAVIALAMAITACTTAAIGFGNSSPQVPAPAVFVVQCAGCHGDGGLGTARGPALALNHRVAEQSADQLDAYLQRGNVAAGMPSFADLAGTDRQFQRCRSSR